MFSHVSYTIFQVRDQYQSVFSKYRKCVARMSSSGLDLTRAKLLGDSDPTYQGFAQLVQLFSSNSMELVTDGATVPPPPRPYGPTP